MPRVEAEDLWTMYLCMVRYSMGRMTYMPGECERLYRLHRRKFKPVWCRQLANEIDAELRFAEARGGMLGHKCDHDAWLRLRDQAISDAQRAE